MYTIGRLCGTCSDGYGVTLDLQSCQKNCIPGIVLFVIICKLIVSPVVIGIIRNIYFVL